MENLSETEVQKLKQLQDKLLKGEVNQKIDYEDWVWIVGLISAGVICSKYEKSKICLADAMQGELLTIQAINAPKQFKDDVKKIDAVFKKLSLKNF